jgi:hypothetical protein
MPGDQQLLLAAAPLLAQYSALRLVRARARPSALLSAALQA